MYTNVNFSTFCDSFSEERKATFSYDGKRALFDYLEELEESTGEEIELDTIALCCEYTEYESLDDCLAEYSSITSREELEGNTTVIDLPGGGLIIQQF
jgi:hypothetical protein